MPSLNIEALHSNFLSGFLQGIYIFLSSFIPTFLLALAVFAIIAVAIFKIKKFIKNKGYLDKLENILEITNLNKEIIENKFIKTDNEEIKPPSEIITELGITENTQWEDIEIRFKNNYDVKITTNNKSFDSDYEKMGFADKRKNKDTKAKESWNLLLLFSVNNNIFPFSDLNIIKKVKQKKQKQELNKLLKAYFGIADDPIVHNKITKNYEMKIKLIPIEDFRQQWADRNIKTENQESGELY